MKLSKSTLLAASALFTAAVPASAFLEINTEVISQTATDVVLEFSFADATPNPATNTLDVGTTNTLVSNNDRFFIDLSNTTTNLVGFNETSSIVLSNTLVGTATTATNGAAIGDTYVLDGFELVGLGNPNSPDRFGFIFDQFLQGNPAFTGSAQVQVSLDPGTTFDVNTILNQPVGYALNANTGQYWQGPNNGNPQGITTAVPEPMSAPVLGAAAIALAFVARRKRA